MECLQIVNFFADNASLFSVVKDIQSTLRNDLTVISNWAFQIIRK